MPRKMTPLKKWMAEHNITYRALSEQMGLSLSGVVQLLSRPTMPTARHTQLTVLGFPVDLLPPPLDVPPGPKPKQPDFPGLRGL